LQDFTARFSGSPEGIGPIVEALRTDHFDLYQFHRVCTTEDVERIFAPGGAVHTLIKAREEGKVRFLGFSAHTVEAALAMMDCFDFDSVLFPINFVCYGQGSFGRQIVQRAKEKGLARLALKAVAHGPWPEGTERKYPKLSSIACGRSGACAASVALHAFRGSHSCYPAWRRAIPSSSPGIG
jgi:aryl-alcohol dehydrogenase-like predicted oxidoreductase